MEDVLDLYEEPYDPTRPKVNFDETSKQLIAETRVPLPPKPGTLARYDYEYQRNGTCNLFMFCEPLSGWREVQVREQRTKVDWAREVAHLLDTRYAQSEKVILICDNLNTHTKGAFYEAFPPEQARPYVRHLDFRYTPKHGSWLNIAENELSSLTRHA